MDTSRAVRLITIAAGVAFLLVGVWAFVGPASFYHRVATFPPYNRHFVHDIGAFNIAIGVALLLSLIRSDAILATLAGAGIGSVFHGIGHFEDRSLGGKTSDPYVFSATAVVLLIGAYLRMRHSHVE
jgi:hypothetical protein